MNKLMDYKSCQFLYLLNRHYKSKPGLFIIIKKSMLNRSESINRESHRDSNSPTSVRIRKFESISNDSYSTVSKVSNEMLKTQIREMLGFMRDFRQDWIELKDSYNNTLGMILEQRKKNHLEKMRKRYSELRYQNILRRICEREIVMRKEDRNWMIDMEEEGRKMETNKQRSIKLLEKQIPKLQGLIHKTFQQIDQGEEISNLCYQKNPFKLFFKDDAENIIGFIDLKHKHDKQRGVFYGEFSCTDEKNQIEIFYEGFSKKGMITGKGRLNTEGGFQLNGVVKDGKFIEERDEESIQEKSSSYKNEDLRKGYNYGDSK